MQQSEKSELPDNRLDQSAEHKSSQNNDNEKSSNALQDATIVIDQTSGQTGTEGDPKKKDGAYGYYLVSKKKTWIISS